MLKFSSVEFGRKKCEQNPSKSCLVQSHQYVAWSEGHFSHRLSKYGEMLQYVCGRKAVICKFTPLSITAVQAIMSKLFSRDEEQLNKQQTSGQKVMLSDKKIQRLILGAEFGSEGREQVF